MKHNHKNALGLIVVLTMSAATAFPAYANGEHGHEANEQSLEAGNMGGHGGMMQMMQMMKQMHGQVGVIGGMSNMPGMGAEGDGLSALLEKYDSDGNGTISIAEFEVAHSAFIRETMVDRFQMLDNDGDGQITQDEITAQMGRMQNMMGMNMGMSGEPKAAGGMGMDMGMGAQNGEMMQNQGN